MKNLFSSLMLLLILGGITSCRSESDPLEDGNHRSHGLKDPNIKKTVSMSFGGDFISESEEPLLRAEDGEKYTAVNVFRTEKNTADAKEEKYAYGLFQNKDEISIDVVTGFTYRFESSILIDREDKLWVNENNHAQPFQINSEHNLTGSSKSYHKNHLNEFQYASPEQEDAKREYMHQLKYGEAYVDVGQGISSRYAAYWYPRVKRFYGTAESFDPGLTDGVEISMEYKCFGLKFEVVGLPAGTSLTVEDITKKDGVREKEAKERLLIPKDLVLSEDNKEWEGTFSMNNLLADSDKFDLKFTWHKGGNVTETFETEVTVKPKTRKVLRININGNPNYTTKGNITFNMENVDLMNEVQEANQTFE
ncbi:MAG: hypothetical protein K2N48_09730 [Muribaculaceae bacterium]|nr:hypothetical protein [Muribaculaceae bacterium]